MLGIFMRLTSVKVIISEFPRLHSKKNRFFLGSLAK